MTVALSTLAPALRIELPGIPNPVLDDAIVRVVRQFFWNSEAWKYTSDNPKDWTAGQASIPALTPGTDIPAGTILKRIDTVKYDSDGDQWDEEISFFTRDELDRENTDWESETGTSPTAWTIDNDGAARIIPTQTSTVTSGLLLRAVIAPSGTIATVIPDFLFYENEETMKAGVFAQLMKQPGKEWTDFQAAGVYSSGFVEGIKRAKSRAEAGFGQPKGSMAYGGIQ